MFASAIVEIIEGESRMSIYAVARTSADPVLLATGKRSRVALMDYRLPDMNGAEAANLISTARPDTTIVFHAADDPEEAVVDTTRAAASASATPEEILETVRRAAQKEGVIPVALFAKAVARQRRLAAEESHATVGELLRSDLAPGQGFEP